MNSLYKQLTALDKKRARLLAQVESQRRNALSKLPKQAGYSSVAELITALQSLKAPQQKQTTKTKSKRAKITDATRAEVKRLQAAGKTGSKIAKTLRISIASVQNIKKALGIVKKRK